MLLDLCACRRVVPDMTEVQMRRLYRRLDQNRLVRVPEGENFTCMWLVDVDASFVLQLNSSAMKQMNASASESNSLDFMRVSALDIVLYVNHMGIPSF